MKLPTSLLLLLISSQLSFSQIKLDHDLRQEAEAHPLFADLKYKKEYYKNGELKYEGWVMVILTTASQTNPEEWIGERYEYRKKGGVRSIRKFPLSDTALSTIAYLRKRQYHKYITYRKSQNPKPLLTKYCVRTYYTRKSKVGNIKKDYCKSAPCKKDGTYLNYHPNNEIKVKGKYRHGKRSGEWNWFDKEGELKRSKNYTS